VHPVNFKYQVQFQHKSQHWSLVGGELVWVRRATVLLVQHLPGTACTAELSAWHLRSVHFHNELRCSSHVAVVCISYTLHLSVPVCAVGPQLHPPAAAGAGVPALPQGLPQVRPSQAPLIKSLQSALQGGVDHMCIVQLASSGMPDLDGVEQAHAVLTPLWTRALLDWPRAEALPSLNSEELMP
jgi:hypothetical protein